MGNAGDVATAGGSAAADAVRQAFRERIGADRFAVWFGEGLHVDVEAAGRETVVTVAVGSGFTAEWLRRTFREELADAIWTGMLGCNLISAAIGDDPYARLARSWRVFLRIAVPADSVDRFDALLDRIAARYQPASVL